jgi:hypothetical protein
MPARNSRSILLISFNSMPDTSDQVLFVYVLLKNASVSLERQKKMTGDLLIHKFVRHHEGGDRDTKLAPRMGDSAAVALLEPKDIV